MAGSILPAQQLTPKPRKKMPKPMALSLLQGVRTHAGWEEEGAKLIREMSASDPTNMWCKTTWQ